MSAVHQAQNHLARHSERGKKTRQTEEEVGRQHQGMDSPGVRQVPEGGGEQRKTEETGCEVICGAPTTLAVKVKANSALHLQQVRKETWRGKPPLRARGTDIMAGPSLNIPNQAGPGSAAMGAIVPRQGVPSTTGRSVKTSDADLTATMQRHAPWSEGAEHR